MQRQDRCVGALEYERTRAAQRARNRQQRHDGDARTHAADAQAHGSPEKQRQRRVDIHCGPPCGCRVVKDNGADDDERRNQHRCLDLTGAPRSGEHGRRNLQQGDRQGRHDQCSKGIRDRAHAEHRPVVAVVTPPDQRDKPRVQKRREDRPNQHAGQQIYRGVTHPIEARRAAQHGTNDRSAEQGLAQIAEVPAGRHRQRHASHELGNQVRRECGQEQPHPGARREDQQSREQNGVRRPQERDGVWRKRERKADAHADVVRQREGKQQHRGCEHLAARRRRRSPITLAR